MVILTVLILLIREHELYFHLIMLFLILLSFSYEYQGTGLVPPWALFLISTLFFFDAIVTGIVFLISLFF